ncbi:MAG: TspO/MBR family protein [Hyphomonas sp.]|tara:strand:- start:3868 stop:4344 length:477 start_codon:yes stop_codon:yes gene_type:complete
MPWMSAVLIVISAAGVSVLGLLLANDAAREWYSALIKPPLAPPGDVIILAWPVALIAVVAGALLVAKETGSFRDASSALGLYFTLLAGGMIWNLAFFGLADAGLAFGVMTVVLILAFALVREFDRYSRTAALLQLPYLGWLMFAAYLTAATWGINSAA